MEAIKRLLLRESLNQPLLVIFEDLHWLDSETQAFLSLLSESVASARLLLLVNYRPEYHHEWGSKTYYTQLRLDPLGPVEAHELLSAVLGEGASLHPLKQLILEKTEGNPFFMEEVVQTLVEKGVLVGERGHYHLGQEAPTLHLPPTVQGILSVRIDRLSSAEKELLQTLAVRGKVVAFPLIQQVGALPAARLLAGLSHLQGAEFIYEQPAFPDSAYTFKHALTQEVLMERRKELHERTAQAIEALYQARLEDHYGDLAHHYSRSGNTSKAITYLHLAGQQAVQRSANAEALTQLTTALELLQTLPDTPERAQQELTLHIALGPPLLMLKGHAAPEVGATYSRARELCQQLGDTPQLFSVLEGLRLFYLLRGELQTARELGEQLLRLAQPQHDPALLLTAHYGLGSSLAYLGALSQARGHWEEGLALYNPQQHHALAFRYGLDPGVVCHALGARSTLWPLGYPEQALCSSQRALTLAGELSHPYSLAFALIFAAIVHQLRREEQLAQERAEAAITFSTEQGFAQFLAIGTVLRGWALAMLGQGAVGLEQLQQGLAAYRATGAELGRPHWLALLAEAYGRGGQAEEGLAAVAEALAVVDKTGERLWAAELYRLQGELTLQQSSVQGLASSVQKEAEECFWKAIEIAQWQQAKSWELRAAMSLSRLWQQQGKKKEAHELLAEIYNWFTEGFDTADLKEAKALLQELT